MQNILGAALEKSLNVYEYVHKHPHIIDKLSLVIKKVKIFRFRLLTFEGFLNSLVLYGCKLNIFRLWTQQYIWGHHHGHGKI